MTKSRAKIHGWDADGWDLVTLMGHDDGYDPQAVIALIAQGADVNVQRDSYTPLLHACRHADPRLVKILLEHDADVYLKHSSGTTPLIFAAMSGCDETTRLLLAHHASLEDTDPWSATALDVAISEERTSIALQLIDAGANVNTHAYHPALGRAAETENFTLVDALVKHGAKVTTDIIDRFASENDQMRTKLEQILAEQRVAIPKGLSLGKKITLQPKKS